MTPTVIIALIAAVAGPIGTYLVAVRKFSGKIETSDAKDLWSESKSIREWSGSHIAALEKRVKILEDGNDELLIQNRMLIEEVGSLKDVITELRDEIKVLTGELTESRERVTELEDDPKKND
jgi:chromosome segregation ATPase